MVKRRTHITASFVFTYGEKKDSHYSIVRVKSRGALITDESGNPNTSIKLENANECGIVDSSNPFSCDKNCVEIVLATTEGATDAEKELVNKKENKSDKEKDSNNDKNEELNFVYVQGGPTKEEGVEIRSTEINSKKIISMKMLQRRSIRWWICSLVWKYSNRRLSRLLNR